MVKRKMGLKITSASYFVSIIVFVLLHHYFPDEIRNFSYLAFLIIPIAYLMTGRYKFLNYSTIILIIYLISGFAFKWWHPGWVLFLTIPIYCIFFPKKFVNVKYGNMKYSFNCKEKTDSNEEQKDDYINL